MKNFILAYKKRLLGALALILVAAFVSNGNLPSSLMPNGEAGMTYAPEVPPPIHRFWPARLRVCLDAERVVMPVDGDKKYEFWTFNGHVPGPFIRARVGDTLEIHMTNSDKSGKPHNIDLHCVTGPGGGATSTTVMQGDHPMSLFKLLYPGIYVFHCAAPPVMDHIANGMYGLILVEPQWGLSHVDHEYYVMQSEIYAVPSKEDKNLLEYSHALGVEENPTYVVFNGKAGSLLADGALKAKTGDKVRIYFGNIGPNKISSFHVIGTIFDKVYREGGFLSEPERGIQTTTVPCGGATAVEIRLPVPGTFTLVDHAIFRLEKGAFGFLQVAGDPRDDIYHADPDAKACPGCKIHP
ncbi:MAG TPA: multicopper oxidase domain-containing protein [bacterium]|nr:multicopper oxidase domain-containing protein [bacterium]